MRSLSTLLLFCLALPLVVRRPARGVEAFQLENGMGVLLKPHRAAPTRLDPAGGGVGFADLVP